MYTCPASSTPMVDIINIPSVSPDITGLSGPVHFVNNTNTYITNQWQTAWSSSRIICYSVNLQPTGAPPAYQDVLNVRTRVNNYYIHIYSVIINTGWAPRLHPKDS